MNTGWKLLVVTLFIFLGFGFCLHSAHYVFAQTDQTASKLQAANTAVEQAFSAVLDAEKSDANVTGLLAQLNVAGGILSQAENSYRIGDFKTAATQANSVLPIAQEVMNSAHDAEQAALVSSRNSFLSTISVTVIGAFVLVLGLFLVWRQFKRGYMKKLFGLRPEVVENTA